MWLPLIVVGEIKAGFLGGNKSAGMKSCCLANPRLGFVARAGTAEQYARLFVQLKWAGTPVADNDLWVAALALQHDLVLTTRDKHFKKIPQLARG